MLVAIDIPCTIADKRNGTPLGFATFKIGTFFFLIKGGKTEQIFLTFSFDVFLYLVKNSGRYLTRLKSYECLKKRKLGDCSVSSVRDSTSFDWYRFRMGSGVLKNLLSFI